MGLRTRRRLIAMLRGDGAKCCTIFVSPNIDRAPLVDCLLFVCLFVDGLFTDDAGLWLSIQRCVSIQGIRIDATGPCNKKPCEIQTLSESMNEPVNK